VAEPGIVILRDDGVIHVPNAIPLSGGWIAGLNALCDQADATTRRRPPPAERRDPPK